MTEHEGSGIFPMPRIKLNERTLPDYTHGEEIFNTLSHIAGGAVGLAALVACVVVACVHKNAWGVVSGAVFGAMMFLLYTASSIYHALRPDSLAKRVFQVIDHCTIFVLIAGTYTPLALVSIRGESAWLGWTIFGVIWGFAILGIALNAVDLKSYRVFSMVCYLCMGWCVVLTWPVTARALTADGMLLLILGGIFYTLGAVLYAIGSKKRYFHSVFHIFVVAGSVMHALCILLFVM